MKTPVVEKWHQAESGEASNSRQASHYYARQPQQLQIYEAVEWLEGKRDATESQCVLRELFRGFSHKARPQVGHDCRENRLKGGKDEASKNFLVP